MSSQTIRTNEAEDTFTSGQLGLDHPSNFWTSLKHFPRRILIPRRAPSARFPGGRFRRTVPRRAPSAQ